MKHLCRQATKRTDTVSTCTLLRLVISLNNVQKLHSFTLKRPNQPHIQCGLVVCFGDKTSKFVAIALSSERIWCRVTLLKMYRFLPIVWHFCYTHPGVAWPFKIAYDLPLMRVLIQRRRRFCVKGVKCVKGQTTQYVGQYYIRNDRISCRPKHSSLWNLKTLSVTMLLCQVNVCCVL